VFAARSVNVRSLPNLGKFAGTCFSQVAHATMLAVRVAGIFRFLLARKKMFCLFVISFIPSSFISQGIEEEHQ
jgi:hypothetical protein